MELWLIQRALRGHLVQVSDAIERLQMTYRGLGLGSEVEQELNAIQIRITELIGRLWTQKTG